MSETCPSPARSRARVAALDSLRGIAVLSVLTAHAPIERSSLPSFVAQVLNAVAYFFSGVDLFFVLSGFLVSGLLLREHQRYGAVDSWRFLVRRGLNIYPSFYVFLIVSIVVSVTFGTWPHPAPANIASEALFVQNYGVPLWSHTWSLAVEEHFYLFLVTLLAWLMNAPCADALSRIPKIVAGVSVACLAMRLLTAWFVPTFSFHAHLAPSHLRFDSLAFGMLLSYWYHRAPEAMSQWTDARGRQLACLAFLLLAVCAAVPRRTFVGHTLLQTIQYVGHGILLLLAVIDQRAQWLHDTLVGRALQTMGRYSYSIYLWHMGVLVWPRALIAYFTGDTKPFGNLELLVYVMLAIPVGVMTARLVEMPVLAIRDHFFPSRSDDLRAITTVPEKDTPSRAPTA